VDRSFSRAVQNGMYSFHASAAAYNDFWNNTFYNESDTPVVTRRIIWQSFIQESVRQIADNANISLVLDKKLDVNMVAQEAFKVLGDCGKIRTADGHSCSECTHPYKSRADFLTEDDPAAIVGIDENRAVPALLGEDAAQAIVDAAQARHDAQNPDNEMDVDEEDGVVNMVVMDGIVMGHSFCAFGTCTNALVNNRGGAFCAHHEEVFGTQCRVQGCTQIKVTGTQACVHHKELWYQHLVRYGHQGLLGFRRLLRRTEEEHLPWLPTRQTNQHPHEEPTPDQQARRTFFTPNRFYCVETLCAPCGVVIAWTKFAKAESPTNILQFLQSVYPTEDSRPDYICIDKACLVLKHAINNGTWAMWSQTSRFIVDSYHYMNHRTSDYLCRKWCNPAPLNGSSPNLVHVEADRTGTLHYKRAFNTQVSILTF